MLNTVQAILSAISRVRFENGKTPPVIRRFLIDQLRFNDNTTNAVCPMVMRAMTEPNLSY